jgi:hypothetical protein
MRRPRGLSLVAATLQAAPGAGGDDRSMKAMGQAGGGPVAQTGVAHRGYGLLDVVVREVPLILALACSAAVLFSHLTMQFAADSWLNLLGGREIVAHGLPRHDTLAVLSQGHTWIDQQWLAHLFYYGAYVAGGLTAAARANVMVFLLAVAGVFWFARRRGAGSVSVALCSIPMLIVGVEFIRAQVLAELLFVALLALLASESRTATRSVFLAFPLLVLWANLHGSVVFAAALVALLGMVEAVAVLRNEQVRFRGLARPLLLITLPWFCIFASPYGTSVLTYFKSTLRNPEFPRYLTEWAAPSLASLWGMILFASAALAIALIARRPRGLTAFEVLALALALVGAITAVRSIPWFTVAVAMLVPELLGRELSSSETEPGLTLSQRMMVVGAAAAAVATVGIAVVRPGEPVSTSWPPAAVNAVQSALREDPSARVLAGYDLADWLLFEAPEVRGRIAFDGRWEILSRPEFLAAMRYVGQVTPGWERFSLRYRLIVLNPASAGRLVNWYERQPDVKELYRSSRVVVFDRGLQSRRS